MPTFSYDFIPGQTVWVLSTNAGVDCIERGVVRLVEAKITAAGTTTTYFVQIDGDVGNTSFTDDVYGDVDAALAAYKLQLT